MPHQSNGQLLHQNSIVSNFISKKSANVVQDAVKGGNFAKKQRPLSVVDVNKRKTFGSSIGSKHDEFFTAQKYVEVKDNGDVDDVFPQVENYFSDKKKEDFDESTCEQDVCKGAHVNKEAASCENEDIVSFIEAQDDDDYLDDAYLYLTKMEKIDSIPVGFLETDAIDLNMRSILVDWIIQVQHHLKLCQETLYLAVGILDKVLYKREVSPDQLQLVGVASLLIASKLEEYYPISVKKLVHLTENSYSRVNVLQMEKTLLHVMNFQVYLPSPEAFMLRYAKAALRVDDETFLESCRYLMDSFLHRSTQPNTYPSHLAASSVLAASLLYFCMNNDALPLEADIWTSELVASSKLSINNLKIVSQEMISTVLEASKDGAKFTGAFVKYKSFSQHKRLAMAKHFSYGVLKSSLDAIKLWN